MDARPQTTNEDRQRIRVSIRGAVQGVGFRPYVYRLANDLHLSGWVQNSAAGVLLEAEGHPNSLQTFLDRLEPESPPHALVQEVTVDPLEASGETTFQIRTSRAGPKQALILPDLATCADCLQEIFDPADRRHRYPFTNCTNCGPRFSIIRSLPYDRPHTTMGGFTMCPTCRREYEDPGDRRFHAQPNACPVCGPQLSLWDTAGETLARGDAALLAAADVVRKGQILALKGLGGFHLLVAATDETAVTRLRRRKEREEKPLALMFPDLAAVQACCEVSEMEQTLLASAAAPIVLLQRRASSEEGSALAPSVAPGNPCLGAMLPYTPLHALLLAELDQSLVATSGNRSDEPICIEEYEALQRLAGIADVFLVHDRPIRRHVDDSVVRVVAGRELVLRRARGYAPLPMRVQSPADHSNTTNDLIAVGAQLKNAVALAHADNVFVSQHIGDLETPQAVAAFREVIDHLTDVYATRPAALVCDLHPDYHASVHARNSGQPVVTVQHHLAHVLSCLAENDLSEPALGVAWDGTGLGSDGTIWGGEFLVVDGKRWWRAATFRTFPLPGGDQAIREPRRTALGLLHEIMGSEAFTHTDLAPVASFPPAELEILASMLTSGLNCPRTSSVGRLFDAVAALAGLRQVTTFEGQAAMELEWALPPEGPNHAYPIKLEGNLPVPDETGQQEPLELNWEPLVQALLADLEADEKVATLAARFHAGLLTALVEVARAVGLPNVALSGGCFQNRALLAGAVTALQAAGLQPIWHRQVPPNDGGIALGQVVAARRDLTGPVAGTAQRTGG